MKARLTRVQQNHNVLLISSPQTYALRLELLRPGRPLADAIFAGDDAPDTFHLGMVVDGQIVAVASVFHAALPGSADEGYWQLRGMAVAPAWQRQGCGAVLIHEAVRRVAEQGGTHLWCNARMGAVAFYEKLGFKVCSDEFEIEDAGPHVRMLRTVP